MKQSVLILGVTGSIGMSTINVLNQYQDDYQIKAIVSGSNWQDLARIAKEHKVQYVGISDESSYNNLKDELSGTDCQVFAGQEGILEICGKGYDIAVAAIAGFAGLASTIAAAKYSKKLCIANKESIVCAWNLINQASKASGCKIIPVDSEHSALFQCIENHNNKKIHKVAITASGGALRDYSRDQMAGVTPEIALKHPNWNMGAKVTIDSATLVNKGLEAIEAAKLFDLSSSEVDVIVHRESIVHGLVYYSDGSVISQLGVPDMRSTISYAIGYPHRMEINHSLLNLPEMTKLSFEAPDFTRFPMLKLALSLIDDEQYKLITFNSADEVAVNAFLKGQIGFLDIERVITETLSNMRNPNSLGTLEEIQQFNQSVIEQASKCL